MRPGRTEYEKYLTYEKYLEDWADGPIEQSDTKNHQVVIIFHLDSDRRPCRPVVQLIDLPVDPQTTRNDIISNPRGVSMNKVCQVCDASLEPSDELTIDKFKIHSVYALAVTDAEARYVLHAVSDINLQVGLRHISLSHRSNLALIPRVFHKTFPAGVRSIFHLRVASSATDVQLAVLMLRESINPGRAITVKLQAMHPYLTTPDNLHDVVSLFTRKLDTFSFKSDSFKFDVL